jgi:hypothetical protein
LPASFTFGAPAPSTLCTLIVAGSTVSASNAAVEITATGTVPPPPTLITFGNAPGFTSISTARTVGSTPGPDLRGRRPAAPRWAWR